MGRAAIVKKYVLFYAYTEQVLSKTVVKFS